MPSKTECGSFPSTHSDLEAQSEPGARSPFSPPPVREFLPYPPVSPSGPGVDHGGKQVTPRAATAALVCLGVTVLAVAAFAGCGEDSEAGTPTLLFFVALQPGGTIGERSKRRCGEKKGRHAG